MNVLLASSEVAPFAKTGGLADVAGALPPALARHGVDVRVIMPRYPGVEKAAENITTVLPRIDVQLGTTHYACRVDATTLPGCDVPVYLVDIPTLFDRPGLYQETGQDYADNHMRFGAFCKAIAWTLIGIGWMPDVIHCNDWQTALLPVMLREDPQISQDAELSQIATLYTIHNMAYQGLFPPESLAALGLPPRLFSPAAMEFYGHLNLMKGALVYADILTTVSPTYAREIQTPEFGCGLEGVLQGRSGDLFGILNGIDYDQWNPADDAYLPAAFTPDDLAGKAACKRELQRELGLPDSPDTPLLVIISRLDPQKGFDILLPLLQRLLQQNVQLAVLGTGLAEYEAILRELSEVNRNRMSATLKFDNGLAHRLEAGGDIFLMPSRYEPCGLNQLYSLRYGTVPVVRHTGGLADSVEQAWQDGSRGTGFVFGDYTSEALYQAIESALSLYRQPTAWRQIQRRGMMRDSSWAASATRYLDLYHQAQRHRRA